MYGKSGYVKYMKILRKEYNKMNEIKDKLETAGYDYAIAIATQAEVDAKAACGQLALVEEEG